MKKIFIAFLFTFLLLLISFYSVSVKSESISPSPLTPPKPGLIYITPPIINWFKYGEYLPSYEWIKHWDSKPFPNLTLMYIGSGIGSRPNLYVAVIVFARTPGNPGSVNVFSDGEYYDTIYPEFWGPISSRRYILFYYEKGFHSLTFIAADNSSRVNIDVQVGFNGFFTNILPYLL